MINMNLENYPQIEDNSIISKFDYYLIYSIILELRITDSNQSIITWKNQTISVYSFDIKLKHILNIRLIWREFLSLDTR
jgi:hypothetical protein